MKKLLITITILIASVLVYVNLYNSPKVTRFLPKIQTGPTISSSKTNLNPVIYADKLQIPWALTFLPDKSILFTERLGRLRLITPSGTLAPTPVATVKDVKSIGEGGLLGIALHPSFAKNHYIYLYYTYSGSEKRTLNKVVRFVYSDNRLSDEKIILSDIPGNANHNGGRLKFGPDGYLYITTGDSQEPSLAQDKTSLAGKILRVTEDGSPAPDNPFGNATYSYGHRNPQGLAWDETGQLWETEHGSSAGDELNLIKKGGNYGWPEIRKNETKPGMYSPVITSGNDTWAPSGLVYLKPYLYFAGLRSNSLYRYGPTTTNLNSFLQGKFGRLRDIALGPDRFLYLTTSNMDGRSLTHLDGDKILRLDPSMLD